jgi:iron-sulfur cluster assembly accessory protein
LTLVRRALNYPWGDLAIGDLAIAQLRPSDGADGTDRTDEMDDITVTERAARRIGDILRREPAGTMLRLSVEGGGCSGFQYKFDTDSAQDTDDIVVRREDAMLLIDRVSLGYLAGSEIDFVDDLIGASFRVNNPKAKASCGCGTSFTL